MDEQAISMAATAEAPDGSIFHILRSAPSEAARLRGEALVEMREIAGQRAPELLRFLHTDAGLSAEYAMSSAVARAEDLGVKADLARVIIKERFTEGNYWGAVRFLTYDGVPEADLPEYQTAEFVGQLYDLSMNEEEFSGAWMIAELMLNEKSKRQIVKHVSEVDEKLDDLDAVKAKVCYQSGWEAREKTAFESHTKNELALSKEEEGGVKENRLQMLYDNLRFRREGYGSEQPSQLALQVAEAYVRILARNPQRAWIALEVIAESGFSSAKQEKLLAILPRKTLIKERIRQRLQRVSALFERFLSFLKP